MSLRLFILAWGLLALGGASQAQQEPPAPASGASAPQSPGSDWQSRIDAAVPGPDDELLVLVHSAKDCPFCTTWKRHPSGLAFAKKVVSSLPKIRMYLVDRASLEDVELKAQYPEQAFFEYERRAKTRGLKPTVPMFDIILKGKVVYRASGLDMWTKRVLPVLLEIEQRREKPAAQPGVADRPSIPQTL